jgi:sulfofructose kinase
MSAATDPRLPVRVRGVGHVALDLVFEVGQIPHEPVKVAARGLRRVVGGMTASACVAAARLGAAVRFGSPVGDDDAVVAFEAHFAREGVEPAGLQRVPGASSSVSAVLLDEAGERLIVSHHGDALKRSPPPALGWMEDADVVLADPRCPPWAEAALRLARELGRPSVLDGDTAPPEDLRRLVALARWAVFSAPGLRAFVGRGPGEALDDAALDAGLAQALALGAEVAVVTLGGRGLRWQRSGAPVSALPARALGPVVDTLGAGDTFHGALAVALGEGQGDEAAMRFASAAAALKCLRPGGVLGAPGRAEVMQVLERPMQRAALPAGAPEPRGGCLAGAHEFLPSPLAGEGLGERGRAPRPRLSPPLPNPSPTRGEGLNTPGRGQVPG